MNFFLLLVVLYISPSCFSQCVNCGPQQPYQSPCCVPTANVQTIQSTQAFTNGAQGSQIIMYYNGQRVLNSNSQTSQQQSGLSGNPPNNYQNPGPIPAPAYQNGYQGNQNVTTIGQQQGQILGNQGQNSNQNQFITGGIINNQDNQGQAIVGGNVGNQNQNSVNNPGQYQDQTTNQYENNQYGEQNYQESTITPSAAEVGYQPFVSSGNTQYGNQQGQYDQQGQQIQQGLYPQNQNNQNGMQQNGGIIAGGAVGSSTSYNSPNSGYVNNPVEPQTYPTQIVTGGAINSQNVQQQPNFNTQYQDQTNEQNNNGGSNNQVNSQNSAQQGQNLQGAPQMGQQGFSTTQLPQGTPGYSSGQNNQQQGFTNAPQGQFQPTVYGQNNNAGTQQTGNPNQYVVQGSPTPVYQQGNQQQSTTPPYNQQGYTNEPQGNLQQSTSGPYFLGTNAQNPTNTNLFQSTTPTVNYVGNGATTGRPQQLQSSTGFQSSTGMPATNDNQLGMTSPSMFDSTTLTPQYPSQQQLLTALSSTQQTPSPQFPPQQSLGATTSSSNDQQQITGVTPNFPSQQELLQRDQQNSGVSGSVNSNGFTPQYGDMNTQYGHYESSTASSNPQFDQPTANQQQPENSSTTSISVWFGILLMVFLN